MVDLTKYLADVGGGVFSAADCERAGLSYNDRRKLLAEGRIERVRHGWFAAAQPRTAVQRHALLIATYRRAPLGSLVFASHSAILHAGAPVYGADLGRVAFCRTSPGHDDTTPSALIRSWASPE